MMFKIAVSGLGNVGRGLLRMWDQVAGWADANGIKIALVAALDSTGGLADVHGLDPKRVLREKERYKKLAESPASKKINAKYVIDAMKPDVFIDMTPTNVESEAPGFRDVLHALRSGSNVVVSSKNHLRSISAMEQVEALANEGNLVFLDGASVMGGTPVFEALGGLNADIKEARAILNGSTNYMLGRLESVDFDASLSDAIRLGYAEADYRYDTQGYDSALKVVGLCNRIFGKKIEMSSIKMYGIDGKHLGIEGIAGAQVRMLKERGKTIKLVCTIRKTNGRISASVGPEILDGNDPLAGVVGIDNAIEIKCMANMTEFRIFMAGPGSGGDVTASRVAGNLKIALEGMKRCRREKHKD